MNIYYKSQHMNCWEMRKTMLREISQPISHPGETLPFHSIIVFTAIWNYCSISIGEWLSWLNYTSNRRHSKICIASVKVATALDPTTRTQLDIFLCSKIIMCTLLLVCVKNQQPTRSYRSRDLRNYEKRTKHIYCVSRSVWTVLDMWMVRRKMLCI